MTTPERFRRRQLIEGVALIIIGLIMIGQIWYFNNEDQDQRQCVEQKFYELTESLEARATLSGQETDANRALWGVYAEAAGLAVNEPDFQVPEKEQLALRKKLVGQLLDYQNTMRKIERERKRNPVPPFPVGVCRE